MVGAAGCFGCLAVVCCFGLVVQFSTSFFVFCLVHYVFYFFVVYAGL